MVNQRQNWNKILASWCPSRMPFTEPCFSPNSHLSSSFQVQVYNIKTWTSILYILFNCKNICPNLIAALLDFEYVRKMWKKLWCEDMCSLWINTKAIWKQLSASVTKETLRSCRGHCPLVPVVKWLSLSFRELDTWDLFSTCWAPI